MIKKFSLRKLSVMEFLQSMNNIQQFLQKEDLADLELEAVKEEFDKKLLAFNESLKVNRKSSHTQILKELDKKRGMLLSSFVTHCKIFRYYPDTEKANTAQKLYLLLDKYGKNIQKQSLQAETAIVNQLTSEFESPEIQVLLQKIGAEKWLKELKKVNTDFEELNNNRTAEQSAKKVGKTTETRNNMQLTFTKLSTYINALITIRGIEKYQRLTDSINLEIKSYEGSMRSKKVNK